MKSILIIFAVLLVTGCCSKRQVVTKDVIKIIYKDTVIYRTIEIKLPPDTVKITDTLIIKDNEVNMPRITKTFGLITTNAEIIRSKLFVTSYLNDSTFLSPQIIHLPGVIKYIDKEKIIEKKYIPTLYKVALWLWAGVILGFAFIFIGKMKKV